MKILILSRNAALYSTQSLVNAATKRGHEVQICDHLLCNMVIQKDKPQLYLGMEQIEGVHDMVNNTMG